jgi:hypothetical protein
VTGRELGLDDFPEPVHGHTIGDVRGISPSATGEEGNELGDGIGNAGPRAPGPGEQTQVIGVVAALTKSRLPGTE